MVSLYSLNYLIERIWDDLELVKVYTKKRGAQPDLSDPICLRKGATIEVCYYLFPAVSLLINQFSNIRMCVMVSTVR
jgi:ribosome-interacting GTPase 1